jgi:hypothetical protein
VRDTEIVAGMGRIIDISPALKVHLTTVFRLHMSVVPKLLFSSDHLKISEDLGKPVNAFSACCFTTVMCCAIDDSDENK